VGKEERPGLRPSGAKKDWFYMFRKYILKRRLEKVASILINRYGFHTFYTKNQIDKTLSVTKNIKDVEFIYLMFLERNKDESIEIVNKRKSLYQYLFSGINDVEIANNAYERAIYIKGRSEIPGDHNSIGKNSNILPGTDR
jgi:hypothetical protein